LLLVVVAVAHTTVVVVAQEVCAPLLQILAVAGV
jgi:hypothetical protein